MCLKVKAVLSMGLFVLVFGSCISAQETTPLPAAGETVERELRGGEKHRYRYESSNDQYVHLVVMQKGIDVAVRLLTGDNAKIAEIDSPNGANGPEPVWYIFEKGRTYIVEIAALEAESKPGKYELKTESLREATQDDLHFVSAATTVRDAAQLGNPRDPAIRGQIMTRFRSAVADVEKIAAHLRRAAGYEQVGRLAGAAGETVLAFDYFDKAIKLYRDNDQKKKAMSAMQTAQTFSPTATEALRRSDEIRSFAASMGDRMIEGYAYREMSVNQYLIGDFAGAVESAQKSAGIATVIGDSELLEANYDNLGSFYTAQQNFAAALEFHLKAVAIQKKAGEPNAGTLLNIGNVYAGLGNHPLAISNYEAAYKVFDKLSTQGMFVAMSNLGSSHLTMGEYDKALEYLLKMKARYRPVDPIGYTILATACSKIASAYRKKGQFPKALEHADQAAEMSRKTGDNFQLAFALTVKSDTYWEMRDFPKALESSNAAIALAKEFGFENVMWSAKLSAAKAYLGLKSREEARRMLEESVAAVDDLRKKFTGAEENTGLFLGSTDAPLKLLIRMEVEDQRIGQAFRLAEKIKARSLLDVLANGKINVTKAMTAEEIKTESKLRNELVSLNAQLKRKDPDKTRLIESNLAKKRLEYEDFRARLYGARPELRLQRGEFPQFDIENVKAVLPRLDGAIVEFVVTDESTLLFLLENRAPAEPKLTAFKISATEADIEASIERFRSRLTKGDPDFRGASRELYDLLLKPAETELRGKTNIVVVPDGALWGLPFQALIDGSGKYLIEKAAVSYAPSATALREMRKKAEARLATRVAGTDLLAFGNPTVGDDTKQRISQRVLMNEKLEPLPEAERLVNELGRIYGANRSKVYRGAAAREQVAKQEAAKFRIVQFATHGILNDASPMYSHLVLARDEKNANEDGLLEAWELKDLDLNADMVILSACDTARGRVRAGEGVIGMTWAAFIAGVPTTVAAQWKVESASTTELMLEFHRQLLSRQKVSKAEALRRAGLRLLKSGKYRHPFYWAGFVLVGDGS